LGGKLLYRLEELTKADSESVGGKCANLGELTRAGFHVPPGFALSLEAYGSFMADTGAGEEIQRFLSTFSADPTDPKQLGRFADAADTIQGIVEAKPMPAAIEAAVRDGYASLSRQARLDRAKVAVRSAGPTSHPGQYDSFLGIEGEEDVVRNVIKVWSSTFNTRSLAARARKKLPLGYDPIGVCVLQMVEARTAGVMFTADPNTGDATRLTLEGSWGLGEAVVSGSVIPDVWMVDRTKYAIIDRRTKEDDGGIACLNDEEVIALAKIGAEVERHFGTPQDIEWAVDHATFEDKYYLLQTRTEKFSIQFAGF
jgi:phosphoenolpyruvate synthase/pyruvate phosphate dikinase